MRLNRYIEQYGYLRTDLLIRIGVLRIVYKGQSAFLYPKKLT
jgi:hypothetical protein